MLPNIQMHNYIWTESPKHGEESPSSLGLHRRGYPKEGIDWLEGGDKRWPFFFLLPFILKFPFILYIYHFISRNLDSSHDFSPHEWSCNVFFSVVHAAIHCLQRLKGKCRGNRGQSNQDSYSLPHKSKPALFQYGDHYCININCHGSNLFLSVKFYLSIYPPRFK